jgi:raffinose/stachyose/melibiose transport system substrate-binding protein
MRMLDCLVRVGSTAALLYGIAGTAARADGLGSSYDPAGAGAAKLTIWWLGNQEVPGIEVWMKDSVAAYEKLHPNVTVQTVLQSTDTYTTTQATACRGGSGPDLWYNWAGIWSLEQVWNGCIVPNEEALSVEDLKAVPTISASTWKGQSWLYPMDARVYPILYNKTLFNKAGLDPSHPPERWDDFIAAAAKLKQAEIDPLAVGLKDGFGGEMLASAFQAQVYSVPELLHMVIDGDFASAKWKSWITKLGELKPYFNSDTTSINFADGLARFQQGRAAMVFAAPGFQQTIIDMVKSGMDIGVMKVPLFGKETDAAKIYEDTPGFQVTTFAKNKPLAGNFLAFLHSQNRMNALYDTVGDLPNDSRWDTSQISRPTDKRLVAWMNDGVTFYRANFYPTDLDVNGNFVVLQGILGGSMTIDQAANTYQNVITKWRSLHDDELANYKSWLSSYGQ